ncbi:MAG: hypothetical protein ACOC1G_08225 [Phycisphaeraceae bacterium]
MTLQRRLTIYGTAIALLLVLGTLWSMQSMLDARKEAHRAAQTLADVEILAQQVRELRTRPEVAAAEGTGRQLLGQRIQYAAENSRLNQSVVETRNTRDPRRIPDTPYARVHTDIGLRHAPLPDVVAFLYHLTDSPGLRVTELHLRTPPGDVPPNHWDTRATLTYLLYAPQPD